MIGAAFDWMTDEPWRFLALLGVILATLMGFSIADEIAWEKYAKQHDCRETSRHGNPPILMMQYVYGSKGEIVSSYPEMIEQPDTVTYQCDNGTVTR